MNEAHYLNCLIVGCLRGFLMLPCLDFLVLSLRGLLQDYYTFSFAFFPDNFFPVTRILSTPHSPPSLPHALQPLVYFCVCSLEAPPPHTAWTSSMLAAADFTVPTSLENAASSHARTEHRSLKLTFRQASTKLHVPANARLCSYSLEMKLTLFYHLSTKAL